YPVAYRRFASDSGVRPFDPNDRAQDVVDRLRGFGLRDPKPAAAGANTTRSAGDVAVGTARRVADVSGSGRITQLRVQLPQVSVSPRAGDDGRAFGAGGGSAFAVSIDPANQGVRLVRRFDPMIGNQRATLFVDGQPVGD